MAWWGIGISAVGTLYSAYTTYQSGQQIEANTQQEAQYQRQLAAIKEQQIRRRIPKSLGTQKAVLSKSGRSFSTGTGIDLVVESAGELELDAQITRFGGDVQIASILSEGSLLEQRATNRAISTVLTGGTAIANRLTA